VNKHHEHFGHEEDYEFSKMMERWGIIAPDANENSKEPETKEPEQRNFYSPANEWCKIRFRNAIEAAGALRQGENPKDAAAGLFWHCYNSRDPFDVNLEESLRIAIEEQKCSETLGLISESGLDVEAWKRTEQYLIDVMSDLVDIKNELLTVSFVHYGKEIQSSRYYIEVMLAAASTVLVFSGNKEEYNPDINEVLTKTFKTIRESRIKEAETFNGNMAGDVPGFIASFACAVVCSAFAYIESQLKHDYDRDYVSAFVAYTKAIEFLAKTDWASAIALPLGSMDYQMITNVWEQVKKQSAKVNNWLELRHGLKVLEDEVWNEELESGLEMGPEKVPALFYFPAQLQFCDDHMNQEDFYHLIEHQRNEQHERRMRTDFLEDLWQYLETTTRERIISAENEWYEGPQRGSCVISAIEHYSLALETELHATIFRNESLYEWLSGVLNDNNESGLRRHLKLFSRNATTLNLNDMSKLLHYAERDKTSKDVKPLTDIIHLLRVAEDDKKFLTHWKFTSFLRRVYQVRNIPAHRQNDASVMSDIHDLRKQILGIGMPSYLSRLVRVKKQISRSEGNTPENKL